MATASLIVTADDLGVSEARNRGILESVLRGVVTEASLMVNAPAAVHGVHLFREQGLLSCLGLHLNLTEGCPVADPSSVSTLVSGASGGTGEETSPSESNEWALLAPRVFLGKAGFLARSQSGQVAHAHLQRETRAQVKSMRGWRTHEEKKQFNSNSSIFVHLLLRGRSCVAL